MPGSSITQVSAGSTAGHYTITFTPTVAGSNQSEQINMDGSSVPSPWSGVTVYTASETPSTVAVLNFPTGSDLLANTSQTLTIQTTGSAQLSASNVTVQLGSTSIPVTKVTSTGTNQWAITVAVPSSLVSSQTLTVSALGVDTNVSDVSIVSQWPAVDPDISDVVFPTGSDTGTFNAGDSYTIHVWAYTSTDQPITGLTASNFAMGFSPAAGTTTTAIPQSAGWTTMPLSSALQVVPGNTPGTYAVIFTPETIKSDAYFGLAIDPDGSISSTDWSSTTATLFSQSAASLIDAGAPSSVSAILGPTASNGTTPINITLEDAYGNPIPSSATASIALTNTSAGTLSASTVTLPEGTGTIQWTPSASSNGTTATITVPIDGENLSTTISLP